MKNEKIVLAYTSAFDAEGYHYTKRYRISSRLWNQAFKIYQLYISKDGILAETDIETDISLKNPIERHWTVKGVEYFTTITQAEYILKAIHELTGYQPKPQGHSNIFFMVTD